MKTLVCCDYDDCKYNENNVCTCDTIEISTFGECYTREENTDEDEGED